MGRFYLLVRTDGIVKIFLYIGVDAVWLSGQYCCSFVFKGLLIHQNHGHCLPARRQSRYLHFGIQTEQLHARLPGPCTHLIYHCTAGILETLAKIVASFVRGFMFRMKHFVIIQT